MMLFKRYYHCCYSVFQYPTTHQESRFQHAKQCFMSVLQPFFSCFSLLQYPKTNLGCYLESHLNTRKPCFISNICFIIIISTVIDFCNFQKLSQVVVRNDVQKRFNTLGYQALQHFSHCYYSLLQYPKTNLCYYL